MKSYLTSSCIKKLSKLALNWLIVLTSTTQFGKLFQISTMRAENSIFVNQSEKSD